MKGAYGVTAALEAARRELPPFLVAPGCLASWARLAGSWPELPGQHLLLECCLAEAWGGVDLHARLDRESGTWLAARDTSTWQQGEGWRLLRRFTRAWPEAMEHAWLSFDRLTAGADGPRLYLRTEHADPGSTAALVARLTRNSPAGWLPLVEAVGRMPVYMGVGPGLAGAVRLVWHVAVAEVQPLLAATAWPGEFSGVAGWLDRLAPRVGQVGVVVDVGTGPRPHLGLEFKAGKGKQRGARWRQLLVLLEEAGLCLPARREALLACADMQRSSPLPLGADREEVGAVIRVRLTYLSHFKLAFTAGGWVAAKGYLELRAGWLGAGTG